MAELKAQFLTIQFKIRDERIAHLEASLAEAKADAKRLDWLLAPRGSKWLRDYLAIHADITLTPKSIDRAMNAFPGEVEP